MTLNEAFYGTYKKNKKTGELHEKEGLVHPFTDVWKTIYMFGGVVGIICGLFMLSIQLQFYLSYFKHPETYDELNWGNFILIISFAVTLLADFLILVIPRVFFCKGAMRTAFITACVLLSAAQVASHYLVYDTPFTFSLQTFGTIFWLIISGSLLIFLYACGISLAATGLAAAVNYPVARFRMWKANRKAQ